MDGWTTIGEEAVVHEPPGYVSVIAELAHLRSEVDICRSGMDLLQKETETVRAVDTELEKLDSSIQAMIALVRPFVRLVANPEYFGAKIANNLPQSHSVGGLNTWMRVVVHSATGLRQLVNEIHDALCTKINIVNLETLSDQRRQFEALLRLLYIVDMVVSDSSTNSPFADVKKSEKYWKPSLLQQIDIDAFFGKHFGFAYPPSIRYILRLIALANMSFRACGNVPDGLPRRAAALLTGAFYSAFPGVGAAQFAASALDQELDPSVIRSCWNIPEGAVSDLLARVSIPSVQVNQTFGLTADMVEGHEFLSCMCGSSWVCPSLRRTRSCPSFIKNGGVGVLRRTCSYPRMTAKRPPLKNSVREQCPVHNWTFVVRVRYICKEKFNFETSQLWQQHKRFSGAEQAEPHPILQSALAVHNKGREVYQSMSTFIGSSSRLDLMQRVSGLTTTHVLNRSLALHRGLMSTASALREDLESTAAFRAVKSMFWESEESRAAFSGSSSSSLLPSNGHFSGVKSPEQVLPGVFTKSDYIALQYRDRRQMDEKMSRSPEYTGSQREVHVHYSDEPRDDVSTNAGFYGSSNCRTAEPIPKKDFSDLSYSWWWFHCSDIFESSGLFTSVGERNKRAHTFC
eukprot:Rmarinus@m.19426